MDIRQILDKYDAMFGTESLEQIDAFLEKNIEDALGEGDVSSIITLVNEMIGFCRDTGKEEKGIAYCSQLITLMRDLEMEGTVPYATSMLNIGNAYRAFGRLEESMECYQAVEVIYDQNLQEYDFQFASLYNNWSLLYQEMGEFEYAKKMLNRALAVVLLYDDAKMEQATTHTNLAVTLLRLGETEEAEKHLRQGLAIYEEDGGKDFHYSGALAAAGDACYLARRPREAIQYYKKAMQELEKHVGQTEAYKRIANNRVRAEEALNLQEEELKKQETKQKQQIKSDGEAEGEVEKKTDKEWNKNVEKKADKELEKKAKKKTDKGVEKESSRELNEEGKNHLAKCREFYEMYGAPMIHTHFAEYEQQIAVGLVGEGSDCFGYDDSISMDHDYQLGFCLWIPEELNWIIGEKLQKEYEELLVKYATGREKTKEQAGNEPRVGQQNCRHGVMTINQFYSYFLDQSGLPEYMEKWLQIPDGALAAATNGAVFRDDAEIFSGIRRKLMEYYPEEVFRYRLAEELTFFSQYGQYNYSRMMARQDYVTAKISLAKWMEHTMRIVYLLNRTYEPYYKWLRKGITFLPLLPEVGDILDAVADMPDQRAAWNGVAYNADEINWADQIALTIEVVARYLLAELQHQGLVEEENTYLASHADQILLDGRKDSQFGEIENRFEDEGRKKIENTELISKIVRLEWQQFQKVPNEGGKADCQKDWKTFQIMRKSQYLTWSQELLISYLEDLLTAEQSGRNLMIEKYARMMKSTAPKKYEQLKLSFPKQETKRIYLQEEIIKIQIAWMEEFSKKYPFMAKNARQIYTTEDTIWDTSYETYLRGELGTYSDQTLKLYGRFVVALTKKDLNLAYLIMENTAKFYEYQSVEEAEALLQKKK